MPLENCFGFKIATLEGLATDLYLVSPCRGTWIHWNSCCWRQRYLKTTLWSLYSSTEVVLQKGNAVLGQSPKSSGKRTWILTPKNWLEKAPWSVIRPATSAHTQYFSFFSNMTWALVYYFVTSIPIPSSVGLIWLMSYTTAVSIICIISHIFHGSTANSAVPNLSMCKSTVRAYSNVDLSYSF